jgi:hypothetical protein
LKDRGKKQIKICTILNANTKIIFVFSIFQIPLSKMTKLRKKFNHIKLYIVCKPLADCKTKKNEKPSNAFQLHVCEALQTSFVLVYFKDSVLIKK